MHDVQKTADDKPGRDQERDGDDVSGHAGGTGAAVVRLGASGAGSGLSGESGAERHLAGDADRAHSVTPTGSAGMPRRMPARTRSAHEFAAAVQCARDTPGPLVRARRSGPSRRAVRAGTAPDPCSQSASALFRISVHSVRELCAVAALGERDRRQAACSQFGAPGISAARLNQLCRHRVVVRSTSSRRSRCPPRTASSAAARAVPSAAARSPGRAGRRPPG